jgi:hypothetical protein
MKYKALGDFSVALPPSGARRDVQAGEVYDLPDTQDGTPDGAPLVWAAEYWEPVTDTKTSKKKEG